MNKTAETVCLVDADKGDHVTDNDDAYSEVDSENRDSNRQQQKHATLSE